MTNKLNFLKIQDGGGIHTENRFFWPKLVNELSDFSEIFHWEAERHANNGHVTKAANF